MNPQREKTSWKAVVDGLGQVWSDDAGEQTFAWLRMGLLRVLFDGHTRAVEIVC